MHVGRRPALRNCLVEQAGGGGRPEERADAHSAGRLAEDSDVAGIAAEVLDVVAHPLERGDLVEDPAVPRAGEVVAHVHEAERAEAVVDRDHDHVVPGERCAVVPGVSSRSAGEPPSMDPHHHRLRIAAGAGGEHVEVQAVLARLDVLRCGQELRARVPRLWRAGPETVGHPDVVPRGRLFGRTPPPGPHRRGRERDAAELEDARLLDPLDLAVAGVDKCHSGPLCFSGGRKTSDASPN